MGSVQQLSAAAFRPLLGGLAAVLLATSGCGSDSATRTPAAAREPSLVQARTVAALARPGSLADVRLRLADRGYDFEEGFPSGQATDALDVTAGVAVDVSAFQDPRSARIAYRATRRLLQFNPGRGLVELHGGTRLYVSSQDRRLTRQERRLFHEIVTAGEATRR